MFITTFLHRLMENRKISMISELALSQDDYTIKVRVIRLWRQTSWNQQLRMIRMILMDEMVCYNLRMLTYNYMYVYYNLHILYIITFIVCLLINI